MLLDASHVPVMMCQLYLIHPFATKKASRPFLQLSDRREPKAGALFETHLHACSQRRLEAVHLRAANGWSAASQNSSKIPLTFLPTEAKPFMYRMSAFRYRPIDHCPHPPIPPHAFIPSWISLCLPPLTQHPLPRR